MKNKLGEKTVGAILDDLVFRLEKTSETPGLDAQEVLSHLLKKPRSWLMAHPEAALTGEYPRRLENLVFRLERGEPLPYVLGSWEFFGLEFELTKYVLIPRPETELLVERAIAWLKAHPEKTRVADIGSGCGCIGIALAFNVPGLRVKATDISPQALEIARHNAVRNGVDAQIEFFRQDLFPPTGEFDLVVSNPPYIPTNTLQKLPIFGREPTLALDGGVDGLGLIRRILRDAPGRLAPGGLLLMELESSEGPSVLSLAYDVFCEAEIHLHKDLAGHERLLEIQSEVE
jgi:release factor glutamine methyltransferase